MASMPAHESMASRTSIPPKCCGRSLPTRQLRTMNDMFVPAHACQELPGPLRFIGKMTHPTIVWTVGVLGLRLQCYGKAHGRIQDGLEVPRGLRAQCSNTPVQSNWPHTPTQPPPLTSTLFTARLAVTLDIPPLYLIQNGRWPAQ
jgi:hypothetical protein